MSGIARLLVDELRISDEGLLGLPPPQLWSWALVALGAVLLGRECKRHVGALGVMDPDGVHQGAGSDNPETSSTRPADAAR